MIEMTLGDIADTLGGELNLYASATEHTTVNGLSDTDSRNISAGDIFFAKPGEFTDGHLFAGQAVAAGAALVVAERVLDVQVPQIIVKSSVLALGELAREVVRRVKARGRLRIVAVTGSNGKTTTKNLLREMFALNGNVVAPVASFNNEVGAPITFLRVNFETDVLVAEMGASHIGEIREITRMAPPDVGIVLMVGFAHAGEFGGIENIAIAKAEMIQALGPNGVAILNADDPRVARMSELAPGRVVWFGLGEKANVRAHSITVDASGTNFKMCIADEEELDVHFPVIGEHHVMNALAAAAAAHVEGVSGTEIQQVLSSVERAERGRMEVLTTSPITVINDAYNANPNSMSAALRTLAQIAERGQRTVAVLGEMAELGDLSDSAHDEIGALAVRLDIKRIIVVGSQARSLYLAACAEANSDNEVTFTENSDEAFELLKSELRKGDLVLLKSSNSAGLMKLADRLGEFVKGQNA